MSSPLNSNSPSDLDVAQAVLAAVKSRLPPEEFDVNDATLFLSSEPGPPLAVFAVGLTGIKYGLIPVEFDIPRSVEALADELVERLFVTRAEWNGSTSGVSSPVGVPDSCDATRPAAGERGLTNHDGDSVTSCPRSQEPRNSGSSDVTFDRSGIWLLSTRSGARLIMAVVIDPATMKSIVTVTRYAAVGQGEEFNGAPLSVDITEPPMIGRRMTAKVIAVDEKYPGHEEMVYGGPLALYSSTPVADIQELTYEMLMAASSKRLQYPSRSTGVPPE